MTEEQFREKYPHSTDEQVRLYCEAVAAAGTVEPVVEPDIPMPLITVPQVAASEVVPEITATTYSIVRGDQYFMRNFSLDDIPPEVPPASIADDLRDILLGTCGFNPGLSPEQRHRLQTTDMSEDDMLAMVVGAPTAREFMDLSSV